MVKRDLDRFHAREEARTVRVGQPFLFFLCSVVVLALMPI